MIANFSRSDKYDFGSFVPSELGGVCARYVEGVARKRSQAEMTDLVKLQVLLSSEELADIERFREREEKRSKNEAARELIRLGLRAANESKRAERSAG